MAEPELSTRFAWESRLIPRDLAHCPLWLRCLGQWPRSLGINLTDSLPNPIVNSVDISILVLSWLWNTAIEIIWPHWNKWNVEKGLKYHTLIWCYYRLCYWSSFCHPFWGFSRSVKLTFYNRSIFNIRLTWPPFRMFLLNIEWS